MGKSGKLKLYKRPISEVPEKEQELEQFCRQWYKKNGAPCFTKELHSTTGTFHQFDNRSLSSKMKAIWKELGVGTGDTFARLGVDTAKTAPSANDLMAASRKGTKLGEEDDEGK